MRPRLLVAAAAWLLFWPLMGSSVTMAQAPPLPPHQFFGEGASVDGVAVPDGSVVTALNADGVEVGSAITADGLWDLQVFGEDAAEVQFRIGASALSKAYAVVGGELTEVVLDLSPEQVSDSGAGSADGESAAPASPGEGSDAAPNEPPAVLPNGGSGGLAPTSGQDDAPRRAAMIGAAALAVAVAAALGFRTLSGRA